MHQRKGDKIDPAHNQLFLDSLNEIGLSEKRVHHGLLANNIRSCADLKAAYPRLSGLNLNFLGKGHQQKLAEFVKHATSKIGDTTEDRFLIKASKIWALPPQQKRLLSSRPWQLCPKLHGTLQMRCLRTRG